MKILLATPLYPPDIAESGRYVKELARRLSISHSVTIVAYGRIPEAVPGVRTIVINKRQPLLFRLLAYTLCLWSEVRTHEVVYFENGASVELPCGIVGRFTKKPFYMHISDAAAHAHAERSRVFGAIERFATKCAKVITDTLPERPELLPFAPPPTAALASYEEAWEKHLRKLTVLFSHA